MIFIFIAQIYGFTRFDYFHSYNTLFNKQLIGTTKFSSKCHLMNEKMYFLVYLLGTPTIYFTQRPHIPKSTPDRNNNNKNDVDTVYVIV